MDQSDVTSSNDIYNTYKQVVEIARNEILKAEYPLQNKYEPDYQNMAPPLLQR
jgi:hypothetical protein